MKRLILFIFIILISSTKVFAAQFSDINEGTELETAVSSLVELGIVNGYEDGTFKPEKTLSRAEACVMLNRAVAMETDSRTEIDIWYEDMFPQTDESVKWFYPSIRRLWNLDLIGGYEDRTFRPYKDISYSEYADVLLEMLFYQPYIEENGFHNALKESGLLDEDLIEIESQSVTRGVAAILLNRALEMPFLIVTSYRPSETEYAKSEGIIYKDVLSKNLQ